MLSYHRYRIIVFLLFGLFQPPQLRESDVELFEDNAEEYIRRDLEGSDVDTRRRAACDLVKGLSR